MKYAITVAFLITSALMLLTINTRNITPNSNPMKYVITKVYIKNEESKLLIMRYAVRPSRQWTVPSEITQKYTEDPTESVIRIAKEQSGLEIEDISLISNSKNEDTAVYSYIAHTKNDVVRLSEGFDIDGYSDYRWVTQEELLQLLDSKDVYPTDAELAIIFKAN